MASNPTRQSASVGLRFVIMKEERGVGVGLRMVVL
jgi:hypothetical protein